MKKPVRLILRSKQIRIHKNGSGSMLLLEALSKTTARYFRDVTDIACNETEIWVTINVSNVELRLIYNYIKNNL